MSLQLLRDLNGNCNGGLKAFIDRFEGRGEPRICWYPSAGEDFRPLIYLHPGFSVINPAEQQEPASPDIFLYTDYFPWQHSSFLDSHKIYSDGRSYVQAEHIEELPELRTSLDSEILDFPEGSLAINRVLFMIVKIHSDRLGEYEFPLIYAFAENESFCAEKLLPNQSVISHIIHVRYGGGTGGGKASGVWVVNVLKQLGCEVFISDGHYFWQEGDKKAAELYPELAFQGIFPDLENIRILEGERWSIHGDVTWSLVS
jgi:hypothetical protein